jgi:hypothetical protein
VADAGAAAAAAAAGGGGDGGGANDADIPAMLEQFEHAADEERQQLAEDIPGEMRQCIGL